MKRARSKKQRTKASQPEHRVVNDLRLVFGYYPTKDGEQFAYMEVEEATHQRYRQQAAMSGLAVGEEITFHMERKGLTATRTGECCGSPGKEAA